MACAAADAQIGWASPALLAWRIRISYTSDVVLLPEFFEGLTAFEWDAANAEKSWVRHQVSQAEAEQVFLNRPVLMAGDLRHSEPEARFFALGVTDAGRHLSVVFTLRGSRVRVISARPMSRRERRRYEQAKSAEAQDREADTDVQE